MNNTIIPEPDRKPDFRVNKMKFWLCQEQEYLLFNSSDWPPQDGVSKIKIVINNERYDAYVEHPEDRHSGFIYADSDAENKSIYNKWQKALLKIEEALLGV